MTAFELEMPAALVNRISSAATEVIPGAVETGLSGASMSRREVWSSWLSRPRPVRQTLSLGRWVRRYVERVTELQELRPDWDSFGGRPLQMGSISAMTNILVQLDSDIRSDPVFSLTPEGGLNCEWSCGPYLLEITSHEDGKVDVYFTDRQSEECELPIEDARDLRKWLWQASAPFA